MTQQDAFDESGLQWLWSAHSIELAETCLRKYQYSKILAWTPRDKSVHLIFGGYYASAIERYHKLRALDTNHEEATLTVVRRALEDTWDRDTATPWESNHNKKSRETLIRSIVWYLEEWKDDPASTVILHDGSPAAELEFTLDLDNGLALRGKLDRLCQFGDDIYVMDQKTTGGGVGQYFFDGFTPDIQMSTYTFVGDAIYNIPVKGVILDVAEIAVGFTRFSRGFIFRTKASLQEWYDNSMITIERARQATRDNVFPMNRTACGLYGKCEFRDICARSPEVRENYLKASFVQEQI